MDALLVRILKTLSPAGFILGCLLFLSTANAAEPTPIHELLEFSYVNLDIQDYLASEPRFSVFLSALQTSKHWDLISQSETKTIFVPTDDALRKEGSSFLLNMVLTKPENKSRLDDLMAIHITKNELLSVNDSTSQFNITTTGESCFKVDLQDGAVKIGPEALITQGVKTLSGYIYYIDRLLWVPYKDDNSCI